MSQNERRRVYRVDVLATATLGNIPAQVKNVSLSGARLESPARFSPGSTTFLSFSLAGTSVKTTANIQRCRLDRFNGSSAIYDIGISFPLQRTVAEVVAGELALTLRRQRANAGGVLPLSGPSFGEQLAEQQFTATGRYLQLTFEDYVWREEEVTSPRQPQNGFTVDAGERRSQIALLQRTYEQADDATRAMISRLASMAISVATVVAARTGTAA